LRWIESPYGLAHQATDEQHGEETASFDERGCHTEYDSLLEFEPTKEAVDELAARLIATRQHARTRKQTPILDAYGVEPESLVRCRAVALLGRTGKQNGNDPPQKP